MKRIIPLFLLLAVTMSSCNIYKKYNRPDSVKADSAYRDMTSADTLNMGNIPWDQIFTDTSLQALIREGLKNNADLRISRLRVDQAEASLKASRAAFAPSVALTPQGSFSQFSSFSPVWSYHAPITASWEIDLFGRLNNAKRQNKSLVMRSQAYQQAVQTQLVATLANSYYTLLTLDRQLEISEQTLVKWSESLETMKALKIAGRVTEAAVEQTAANNYAVAASIPMLKQSIISVENAISTLVGWNPRAITRGKLGEQILPTEMHSGVPLQLLSNRPDVKAAEMALSAAFYNTAAARSAFYPNLVISGSAGLTNLYGATLFNPGKFIASATALLTQPLFQKGANKARLRIAKSQQEEALIVFQQSVINASGEVSNALTQYSTAEEKLSLREKQVESLGKTVDYTQELLKLGTSTYLEVLTAQQSLLSAQLQQTDDEFLKIQAVINLYSSLGGGRQ